LIFVLIEHIIIKKIIMDTVSFTDILVNVVVPLLSPIDLYNLSCVCRHYAKKIGENDFKARVDSEIEKRLMVVFRENYVEFKKLMSKFNAMVVGLFVVQSMFDEDWHDFSVDIISDGEDRYAIIYRFLDNCSFGSVMKKGDSYYCFTIGIFSVRLSYIYQKQLQVQKYDINKYAYQYTNFGHNIRIYSFKNLVNRVMNIDVEYGFDYFAAYHDKGFRFYLTSDKTKKILSNAELQNMFDSPTNVTVSQIAPSCDIKTNDMTHRFIVQKDELISRVQIAPMETEDIVAYRICDGSLYEKNVFTMLRTCKR